MTKSTQNKVIPQSSLEDIKEQIQSQLLTLSPKNLEKILEITTYLLEQEREAATQEIREIPSIMQLLEIAESQVENGELIDWKNN